MKVDNGSGLRDGGDGAVMNERDLQILALADAREVMDQGLEAAASALEELGSRELSQREAGMKTHLEAFVRSGHRKQTLEELGVSRQVYESSEFTEFDRKFREDVPVEEVYGLYAAAHPECAVHTLGTLKSRDDPRSVKDFYSFQEAKQFTRRDLDRNPALFRAVMDSMPKWGK